VGSYEFKKVVDLSLVQIENLKRVYKTTTGVFKRKTKEIVALDGIDLSIAKGELFGLLGPNGAGKTTVTKILSTVLLPTSGSVKIFGLDVVDGAKAIRPRIGIVFGGDRGLYWRLSARDNLHYFADLYHLDPRISANRIPELLELVGLTERAEERVEGYSRGMKQRVHIARGLLHDPEILFLDEPTVGLDPVAARELRQVIADLRQSGKTIFLTSHYMFEVDALCDRVAIIQKGKVLVDDTPAALKKIVSDLEVVEITCYGVSEAVIQQIRDHPAVNAVRVEVQGHSQTLHLQTPESSEKIQDFLGILNGVRVDNVMTRKPTLEDAYVKIVGSEKEKP
jgi:ABC-2 type transport system ATP-binding protein